VERSGNVRIAGKPEVGTWTKSRPFWALGHHDALGWSRFGIEDLSPDGQVAQAYKLLSPMLPQLAEWQAAGKADSILVIDGEKSQPVSLGGYKITLSAGMGFGTPPPKPDSEAELACGVSLQSGALSSDKRPFAIVVNTAPDEFLFIGANAESAAIRAITRFCGG
jgi:hypothetical protein